MSEPITVSKETLEPITDEIVKLLVKKNHDYGSAWEVHGIAGVLVRLSDKALRLERIGTVDALVVDEKAEDTLMDMVGYCLLGLLKIRASQIDASNRIGS